MMYIVKMIHKSIVICEDKDGNEVVVSSSNIKGNVKEGDILIRKDYTYVIDEKK